MALTTPHAGLQDFDEGPAAANKFRAAIERIAVLPKSVAPRAQPQPVE